MTEASTTARINSIPDQLEQEIDAVIRRYPQPRSAVLMVLHRFQEQFGYIDRFLIEWTAKKLGLQPIAVWELVTFYPMFHQEPIGRFHFKICRTLSCALAGSVQLHRWLCERLGLDPTQTGPQTTADGRFTVEMVECVARCHEAPVVICNEEERGCMDVPKLERWIHELESRESEQGDHTTKQ